MRNVAMNPITNSIGVRHTGLPSQMVAIQQNIWTPVGTAMNVLAAVKKLEPSSGTVVANM